MYSCQKSANIRTELVEPEDGQSLVYGSLNAGKLPADQTLIPWRNPTAFLKSFNWRIIALQYRFKRVGISIVFDPYFLERLIITSSKYY